MNLLVILFSTILQTQAADDHCSYFKYCGNASQSSTSKSMPSTATSSNFNPSNISNVKGLGVETLLQPNNPVGFNIVTGTGKVGGALITPTSENSFFGNRAVEIDDLYYFRRGEKKRYKTKKINVALGAKVLTTKHFAFDVGVSVKRNPEVKKINPGFGFSMRLGPFNIGAYRYKDDTKIDLADYVSPYSHTLYSTIYGSTTYIERFTATTMSIGTQIGNLSLDAGMIQTKYGFYQNETKIMIFSTAYNQGNFLYNFAYRKEASDNLKEKDHVMSIERNKNEFYAGIQYLWNKHLTTGMAYNNFLVNDISFTVTLFL